MFSTWLYTKMKGKCVGTDSFGNQYFIERPLWHRHPKNSSHRWVIYQGRLEASKVPANWHRWLHGTTDTIPTQQQELAWEKPHLPNLSGTHKAYQPSPPAKKTLDYYKPWKSSKVD